MIAEKQPEFNPRRLIIARNINKQCKSKKMSKASFIESLEGKVKTINQILEGEHYPTVIEIHFISKALNVEANTLLGYYAARPSRNQHRNSNHVRTLNRELRKLLDES